MKVSGLNPATGANSADKFHAVQGGLDVAFTVAQIRARPTSLKSSNATLGVDELAVHADASAGSFTLTLPAAATMAGQTLQLTKIDATTNVVTIAAAGGEFINADASIALEYEFEPVALRSTGTAWRIAAT